jgi:Bacterial extracellular solute-binding protein
MSVAGVDMVGPLPPDLNNITVFAAGIGAGRQQADAATALIRFLHTPEAQAVFKAKGVSSRLMRRKEPSRRLYGVLRDTVAERPILFLHFKEIDEHILRPQSGLLREQFDDAGEKRLFLIDVS